MKEDFIKSTPLFADLSEEEQRAIGERMQLEEYSPNETVFVKGDESNTLYLIQTGWVKLVANGDGPTVANLGPGSLLGETDFFLGQPRSTTAKTSGNLTVWALSNTDLAEIIAERPQIGVNLGLALGSGIVQYYRFLTQQLTETPLFRDLSERERALIAQHLAPQRYLANEAIFRSGDAPTGLFLIEDGIVRLLGDEDDDYAELLPGELFGEMAVIAGKPHSQTAQAAIDTVVWALSPSGFTNLTQIHPSIKTTFSRNLRASLSASDQAYAVTVLERIPLFQDLAPEALTDIARLLLLHHVPAGEFVFNQGDSGDAMYIVDSGLIEAVADNPGKPAELVARFVEGDFFGELALLTGKTRSFTAYAAADVNLWTLYRADFDNLLVKYPQLSAALGRAVTQNLGATLGQTNEPHLKKIALLGGLSRLQLNELANRLQPRRYQAGSVICYEGQPGEEMYFIENGQVELWATTMQGPVLVSSLGQGDFFGEIALVAAKKHPATAHVLVDSTVWSLARVDFDDLVRRQPALGLTFSRILSERLDETMNRMRRAGPQRAIPPQAGGPMGGPPVPVRPVTPGTSTPSRPAFSGGMAMPPVPVRPVSAVGPSRSGAALPPGSSGSAPTPGASARPSIHSQHTHGMPPIRPTPESSIHSQHTHGMPPIRPESGRSTEPPKPKRKNDHRPRRKGNEQTVPPEPAPSPVGRGAGPLNEPSSRPAKPASGKPRRRSTSSESGPATGAESTALVPQSGRSERRRTSSSRALQPVVASNRRISRYNNSFSVWFAKRSLGAKLRLLFFLLVLIWLCGIMAPSFIIRSLASTFEDNGALPGDERSIVNQVRQDGAVGAVSMLPFVETATATPTNSPTPTTTPTASATTTETPIPTLTHTPTTTPTPTDTPTPEFTPTPSSTPTRAFARPAAPAVPTDTPTPEPTPTPNVDFRLKSVRQLTPCENRGKHHIFVKVQDPSGQGINGVPVKIQWAPTADGFVVAKTESKTNLQGQIEPGHIDFAMFKGTYQVEIQGGTSEIASGITPDFGTNEACGEDTTANSLFHLSFEVIFERAY